MDAYPICSETKTLVWLGKQISSENSPNKVILSHNASRYNHEDLLLNKVLSRFLADNVLKELRVVFGGEVVSDEYERISTSDIEAKEYVRNWPR